MKLQKASESTEQMQNKRLEWKEKSSQQEVNTSFTVESFYYTSLESWSRMVLREEVQYY